VVRKSKKYILLPAVILFCTIGLFGQDDYSEGNTDPRSSAMEARRFGSYLEFSADKNWVYLPLPVVGYSPETGLLAGASNQVFYRKKGDTASTASNVELNAYYTLERQYVIEVKWLGYFNNDNLIFYNETEFSYFPILYYGIGADEGGDVIATYSSHRFAMFTQANMRLNDVLWIGPVLDFRTDFNTDFADIDEGSEFEPETLRGHDGFVNSGLGIQLVYDSRDHKRRTLSGIYFGFSNTVFPEFLGSSNNNFSMTLDYRHFFNPRKGAHALGYQAIIQSRFGKIPFQALSTFGGKQWMRGYYEGRYRDLHAVFLQTEYRFPIFEKGRLYGAAFMSVGDVFSTPGDVVLTDLKAAIGGGLRILLDTNSRTSIRFDYARTRDGDNGYYLSISEAF
jgi:hypothetical protein